MARVLEHLVGGLGRQRHRDPPRGRVDVRIGDRHVPHDGGLRDALEPLDHVVRLGDPDALQAAAGPARRDPAAIVEVPRLDDEDVALPVRARIAHPLTDAAVGERPVRQRDDARIVNHLVVDDDVVGRLQNAIGVVVAGGEHRAGDPARDAPVPHAHVPVVVALVIEAPRLLVEGPLLHRGPAARRVDDHRGLSGRQHRVARVEPVAAVAAAEGGAGLGAPRRRRVLGGEGHRPLLVEGGHLLVGQVRPRLVREPLDRRDRLVPPNALEVGLAVGRPGRRPARVADPVELGRRRQRGEERESEHDAGHHEQPAGCVGFHENHSSTSTVQGRSIARFHRREKRGCGRLPGATRPAPSTANV